MWGLAQRAEQAAHRAEAAAAAAGRLKGELEGIQRDVQGVPGADLLLLGDEPSGGGSGSAGPAAAVGHGEDEAVAAADEGAGAEEEQAASAGAFVERLMAMEQKLNKLEDELASATSFESHKEVLLGGLKPMIQDVRRCVTRCELLFQLPQIRHFVKLFQRSLQVNAILHERWLGTGSAKVAAAEPGGEPPQRGGCEPMGGEPPPPGAELLPPSSRRRPPASNDAAIRAESPAGLERGGDRARSSPDLAGGASSRPGTSQKRDGTGSSRGPRRAEAKRKPFRTVVDWVRPHIPLKVDPTYKGHGLGDAGWGPGPRRDAHLEEKGGNLPHISSKT